VVEGVKTGDFVLPGDLLAMAEEFIPGEGTYEEGGGIYSSRIGIVLLDARTKKASVHPKTRIPPVLKRGSVIIGRVEKIGEQWVEVEIGALRGSENRQPPIPDLGSIHVSDVRREYVKDIKDQFRPGDIVRAKVVNPKRRPIQLSTEGENLGVILATCSNCRTPLERDGMRLVCPNCGHIETRKIADDYRQGRL